MGTVYHCGGYDLFFPNESRVRWGHNRIFNASSMIWLLGCSLVFVQALALVRHPAQQIDDAVHVALAAPVWWSQELPRIRQALSR